MDTLIFTCKTVTPLAMSGADGKTPELRPPGIKAALRFWWRALHGHLEIEELRKKEGEIFGDTKQRSKVLIKVIEDIDRHAISTTLLPHKSAVNKNAPPNAFPQGSQFKIKLTTTSSAISADQLKSLFVLTCTLGGLGKRSRRGFGSVIVEEVNNSKEGLPGTITLKDILFWIKAFSDYYVINNNKIIFNYFDSSVHYGYIKEIEIGNQEEKAPFILKKISKTINDIKKTKNIKDYNASMGTATNGRYASPLVASIIGGTIRPIITTLNVAPSEIDEKIILDIQSEFKSKIL